jgi:hypothetical protein
MSLFEIHDQRWCPSIVRNAFTHYLQTAIEFLDAYGPIRQRLFDAVAHSGASQIVDLCSGAGGPWCAWQRKHELPAKVVLTDLHPNAEAVERINSEERQDVTYWPWTVDATNVDVEPQCFRTMFSAFHHFSPPAAKKIVDDAVRHGNGIGIFETTNRTVLDVVRMMIFSVIGVLLLTPRIPTLTWRSVLLTYVLPVIPLVVMIDGVLSCMRSYSVEELKTLAQHEDYEWEAGVEKGVTFLIGRRAAAAGRAVEVARAQATASGGAPA